MPQQTINTPRDTTLKTTEQTPRNIADVLADELAGIAQAIADGGSTDYDDLTHRPEINSVTLTGDKSADDLNLAMQEDLTSIKATGTTNATGSTITSGTFFYLDGTLCKAKVDIADGATFTLNTNYEVVTAGGLNALNSNITTKNRAITAASSIAQNTISCKQIGDLFIISGYVRVSANSSLAAGTTMFTINNFEGFSSGSSRYGVASVGNGASLEPLSRSCRINNLGQVFIEDVSTPASYYITIMLVFTLH